MPTQPTKTAPAVETAGKQSGQAHEFTFIAPLKSGGAQRMRDRMQGRTAEESHAIAQGMNQALDRVKTVHDFRFVIFDNDTRVIFASTYDGGFEQYIKDFSTIIPDAIDYDFQELEGYPGVRNPEIWNFIRKYQIEALMFYSAYPDVPVRQVLKGQRVIKAFEQLLDEAQQ